MRKATVSFGMFLRRNVTKAPSGEVFSWNFAFETSAEICLHISSLIKIGQNDRHFTLIPKYFFWFLDVICFRTWDCVFSGVEETVMRELRWIVNF
jgi:hypothetical protein